MGCTVRNLNIIYVTCSGSTYISVATHTHGIYVCTYVAYCYFGIMVSYYITLHTERYIHHDSSCDIVISGRL
jgi:hypothetical protein